MLKLEGICKSFGSARLLDGLNLEVETGELFGFVGANGAGKTTTLKIIVGLLKADAGNIYLDDSSALNKPSILKEKVGYVPDYYGVYNNLTVMEYMEFYGSSYYLKEDYIQKKSDALLKQMKLEEKKQDFVENLSRGMRQRLCLARALIHNPEILILDEPFSGLDPASRVELREILGQLSKEGKTIILSSHILEELTELCTSIGILRHGKIALQGSMEDIAFYVDKSNPIILYIYKNMETAIELLKQDELVETLTIQGNRIMITYNGGREDEAILLKRMIEKGVMINSFFREQSSLESLFLKMTQEGEE